MNLNKPRTFEELVAKYFKDKGYKVSLTTISGDYGVDVFAENSDEKIAIQVKMYGDSSRKINRKSIMELHGAKDYFDCQRAVMAINGDILKDAQLVAKKLNIEILRFKFDYHQQDEISSVENNSFNEIWKKHILPLKGKELISEKGLKNTIVDVDWSGVKRLTSNGSPSQINIEIFKEAYNILITNGQVSRDYINQNYPGRASSGVILILSQLPFVKVKSNPLKLIVKDETNYLLQSTNNSKRLLQVSRPEIGLLN